MSDGSVSTTFDYDTAGRLAHRRDIIGAYAFDSRYTYDGNDQVKTITYPSGRIIEYERTDPEGRITGVFETARNYASSLTYHASGALESYLAGNILTTLTYDPDRYWVQSINAGPLVLNYGNYDGVGNVGTIADSRGPTWGQAFTYDPLHRVATADGVYGHSEYAYDAHGNRQTNSSGTYVYDPDTLRLTAQDGAAFGYDSNGNLTSKPGATYTYTPENWLATVNGTQATYLYDADGWRAKKSVTGDTTFYLRGPSGELLTEWHELGATARARDYVYAGSRLLSAVDKPVAFTTCGGESIPDGSPTSLTIPSGGTGSFPFEGSACRRVSAVITAAATTSCLGTLTILKPDGTQLGQTGGAGCAGTILEPLVLPVSGTYTVVVNLPYQTGSGQVEVSVYDVVDVTGPMTFGQAVNASFTTPGQRGVWTFTGSASQRVSAVITAAAMTTCLATLKMFKPDGTQLGSAGGAGCAGAMLGPLVLPVSGPYTVVVDPYKTATGELAVTAYDVVDVTGPIMVNGSAVTGPLTTPGQNGLWTFDGTSGQQVRGVIDASTVTICVYGGHKLKILKPDGTPLASQNGVCAGSTVGPSTLPTSGIYTIVVDPSGSYTGNVTVRAVSP